MPLECYAFASVLAFQGMAMAHALGDACAGRAESDNPAACGRGRAAAKESVSGRGAAQPCAAALLHWVVRERAPRAAVPKEEVEARLEREKQELPRALLSFTAAGS